MYGATVTSSFGQDIDHDLETLRGNIDRIGTASDSRALRQSIKGLRCELKRKISNEQCSMLLQRKGRSKMSKQQRAEAQKLTSYIERLNRLMEREKTSIQSHPYPTGVTGEEEPDWGGTTAMPLLQHQRVDAAKMEREATEIQELMRDIADLNQIQQDIAKLVVEQGDDVNNIEVNVSRAEHRVNQGARNLGEAARLQRFSRRKKCCIAVCVCVAIGIPLILAIILAVLLVYFLVIKS